MVVKNWRCPVNEVGPGRSPVNEVGPGRCPVNGAGWDCFPSFPPPTSPTPLLG